MKRNNKAAPYPHIPKQGQFEILGRPNLKQTAPKEVEQLIRELIQDEKNVDFEVIERSTESSNKITSQYTPPNTNNKTQKSSSKITPALLDPTKSKTRVTKTVEITDMPKVSNIDKPSHPRIKKITEILDTPELSVNTADWALTAETPPITEFNRNKQVLQIQDPKKNTTKRTPS